MPSTVKNIKYKFPNRLELVTIAYHNRQLVIHHEYPGMRLYVKIRVSDNLRKMEVYAVG